MLKPRKAADSQVSPCHTMSQSWQAFGAEFLCVSVLMLQVHWWNFAFERLDLDKCTSWEATHKLVEGLAVDYDVPDDHGLDG